MQDAVRKAHSDPKSQVLWNTMSLKYLIQKFKYDNLELSPVDMPNGEYKFMSNNQELLNKIDSIYIILNSEGQFQAIQNKWFYPNGGIRNPYLDMACSNRTFPPDYRLTDILRFLSHERKEDDSRHQKE